MPKLKRLIAASKKNSPARKEKVMVTRWRRLKSVYTASRTKAVESRLKITDVFYWTVKLATTARPSDEFVNAFGQLNWKSVGQSVATNWPFRTEKSTVVLQTPAFVRRGVDP